jgi:hypothetical protein
MMDSWKLAKGEKVFELPETWVIFIITDGTKKQVVVTPMTCRCGGKHYYDGQCELYPGVT